MCVPDFGCNATQRNTEMTPAKEKKNIYEKRQSCEIAAILNAF